MIKRWLRRFLGIARLTEQVEAIRIKTQMIWEYSVSVEEQNQERQRIVMTMIKALPNEESCPPPSPPLS